MNNTPRTSKPLCIAVALLLTGCGDGWDKTKVHGQVAQDFPGGDISRLAGKDFTFIVRKADGSVWQVEYMGNDLEITAQAQLIGAMKCNQGVEK